MSGSESTPTKTKTNSTVQRCRVTAEGLPASGVIAKDVDGLWDYYQEASGAVFYDGTFRGCRAGFFGDAVYWGGHISRGRVLFGPWPTTKSLDGHGGVS
jgi:hypothetical protein